jgi:hypothetical protein
MSKREKEPVVKGRHHTGEAAVIAGEIAGAVIGSAAGPVGIHLAAIGSGQPSWVPCIVSTGTGDRRTSFSATLPRSACFKPLRPCVPITTMSG